MFLVFIACVHFFSQIRALVRLGAVRALCASLRGGKGDPKTCAVAADGLAQLLRKAGGGDSATKGAVAQGSPAYRWRRKVVKAVRASGGDHALKKLASSAGPGAGVGSRHGHKKGSNSGVSSAAQEAGAKATALLGLIALTKEVLARARRDARGGAGKPGKDYSAEDEDEEAEDDVDPNDDDDEDDDREDEQDDRDLAAAKSAGFGIHSIHNRGGGLGKYTNSSSGDRGVEGGVVLEDNSGDADDWGDDDDDDEDQGTNAVKVVCGRGMKTPSPTSGEGGAHRLVSVAPASDRKNKGASSHSPDRTPGKVEVRRLGPGNVSRHLDDEYKDNDFFDEGDGGVNGAFLSELGEEAKLAAAMAALERDLGLVQLASPSGGRGAMGSSESSNEMGKPKRGWTAAWDV